MTNPPASLIPARAPHISLQSKALTRVELVHVEKRIEYWVRFGEPVAEQVLDRRRRHIFFAPASVFCFVRWAGNEHGTIISRIDIVRVLANGEPFQTLPFVRPGGDILLKIEGWPKVERVLRHIDTVEKNGIDPCAVAPDHWRHVGHCIRLDETPSPYTMARHQAWLRRCEFAP